MSLSKVNQLTNHFILFADNNDDEIWKPSPNISEREAVEEGLEDYEEEIAALDPVIDSEYYEDILEPDEHNILLNLNQIKSLIDEYKDEIDDESIKEINKYIVHNDISYEDLIYILEFAKHETIHEDLNSVEYLIKLRQENIPPEMVSTFYHSKRPLHREILKEFYYSGIDPNEFSWGVIRSILEFLENIRDKNFIKEFINFSSKVKTSSLFDYIIKDYERNNYSNYKKFLDILKSLHKTIEKNNLHITYEQAKAIVNYFMTIDGEFNEEEVKKFIKEKSHKTKNYYDDTGAPDKAKILRFQYPKSFKAYFFYFGGRDRHDEEYSEFLETIKGAKNEDEALKKVLIKALKESNKFSDFAKNLIKILKKDEDLNFLLKKDFIGEMVLFLTSLREHSMLPSPFNPETKFFNLLKEVKDKNKIKKIISKLNNIDFHDIATALFLIENNKPESYKKVNEAINNLEKLIHQTDDFDEYDYYERGKAIEILKKYPKIVNLKFKSDNVNKAFGFFGLLKFNNDASKVKKLFDYIYDFAESVNYNIEFDEQDVMSSLNNLVNGNVSNQDAKIFKTLATLYAVKNGSEYIDIARDPKNKKLKQVTDISYNIDDNFKFEVLPSGDLEHLTVGLDTNCCQRIGAAGEVAAIDSFINPTAGVLVLRDAANNVIAQSYFHWVWPINGYILDNVESNDGLVSKYKLNLDRLYAEMASHLKNTYNVENVLAGKAYSKVKPDNFETTKLRKDPRRFSTNEVYTDFNHKDAIDLLRPKFSIIRKKKSFYLNNKLIKIAVKFEEDIKSFLKENPDQYKRMHEIEQESFSKYEDGDTFIQPPEDIENDFYQPGADGVALLDDDNKIIGYIYGYNMTDDELEPEMAEYTNEELQEKFNVSFHAQIPDNFAAVMNQEINRGKVFYIANLALPTSKIKLLKLILKLRDKLKQSGYQYVGFDALSDSARLFMENGVPNQKRLDMMGAKILAIMPTEYSSLVLAKI